MPCSVTDRTILLGVAHKSIQSGLQTGSALKTVASTFPSELMQIRSSFVTLKQDEQLRGCIGSLEATTRLVDSVAENAYAAAFRDPRFPALTAVELDDLTIELSVLGPLQAVHYQSEAELVSQLEKEQGGWVIQEGHARGTFLPSVWDALPDAKEFLKQLKMKAGLPADYWSDHIEMWHYSTESFSAHASDAGKYAVPGFTSG